MTSIEIIAPLKAVMGKVKGMGHYYTEYAIAVKTHGLSQHLLRYYRYMPYSGVRANDSARESHGNEMRVLPDLMKEAAAG